MSTRPTTLPENDLQVHGAQRRWLPRLRDARIRSKLALILVVPVAAVIALASVRLVDVGRGAYDANLIRSLTRLSVEVSALTQDLHKERMQAAAFLAAPSPGADAYNLHVRRTDEQIAAYTNERKKIGAVPAAVEDRLKAIDDHLSTLNATRQDVLDRKQMPVAEAVLRYGVIITDLVAYGDVLGQLSGEGSVAESLRAVAAFARAKAATAEEEAVTFASLTSGRLDQEQFSSFIATLTSQQEALLAFSLAATPQQQTLVDTTVTGDAVVLADQVAAEVTRSMGQTPRLTATEAARAIGAVTDLMRWAEIRLGQQLLAKADEVSASVVRQAVTESVLVLITLALAIALAIVLARSLNRSLRQLREGALAVANRDLPDAVARLRDVRSIGEGGAEEIVRQVRDPIRLTNRDEVGQVAQAFNVVHKEAVRIAAEQAALRTSVSAMFLNLARRSQALVDRMIGELDMIERGEEDPKRLAQLFELDHLATRMRRNDENLLVLAGGDSTAPRREDALLVDALRAAQSEVELYNRIEFGTVDTDISVSAHAVNDVVRLVAELLDNATRFSPPNTTVIADARRIRDYVLIQVEDRGLGLAEEQMDALNRRLAQPSTVDAAAFRLMGLAVVSRLASRYGIRVELRPNVEGGTVAQVTLPSSIIVLPHSRVREQLPTRPRAPLAVEPGPSAAPMSAAGAAWSEPVAPAVATLPDAWRTAQPAQWETSAASVTGGYPVTAAQTGAAPIVSQPAAPQPAAQPAPHSLGNPTVVYPTVPATPQRASGGSPVIPATAHPLSPAVAPAGALPSGPVAGSPLVTAASSTPAAPATGSVAAPATAANQPEDSGELPIFREMEAVWFRSHGQDHTQIFTMPTAGYAPPPAGNGPSSARGRATPPRPATSPGQQYGSGVAADGARTAPNPLPSRTPGEAAPPQAYTAPAATPPPAVPRQRTGDEGGWRTPADEGWRRASQAAEPAAGGTTRSGLPKRVPQAQLVPGGVESNSGRERTKRTPDGVRGLLSAYHRGVQRGRSAGSAQNGTTSTKETSG